MIQLSIGLTAAGKQRDEIVRTLRSFAGATGARRGCLGVRLVQEIDNRAAITWCEEWESEADLRRHVRSDEFRVLLAVMELSMSAPKIRVDEVSSSRGLDWIAAARGPGNGEKSA